MPYIKFKGRWPERDLIKAILSSSQASLPGKNFPRVTVIGRTKIHPDIDILQIRYKSSASERLTGFEVKIVKLEGENQWNWEEIYKGIGQAFLYLQFGLDQCGLILGFHDNVPENKIEEFYEKLKNRSSLLTKILGKYFNFGIFLWEGGGIAEIVKAEGDFLYLAYEDKLYGEKIEAKIKNFKSNLLIKEFWWDKKLAQNCKYAEK